MPRAGTVLAAGALALAASAASACSRAPWRRSGPPNVLLISLDTLRADRLGSYGHAAARTPVLDGLAARGARFLQATTVVPLTLPAHASLLTGTFPSHHGVRDNGGFYLEGEHVTLAETLKDRGYRTGGFVGSFVLDARWGIHQGFDEYFDDFDLSQFEGEGMDAVQRRGDEVVAKALEWLGRDHERPFFAWVHLYDPHTPYAAPEPYRSQFPATLQGAYDAEVAWTDALVGRLLAGLEADGRLDRTLLAVVGDHGESLGEHGEVTHGFFIYDAAVQVPLIVAGPGVPVAQVKEQVRIVDVLPTLLELLKVAAPPAVQGTSLTPAMRGQPLGLVALSETYYPRYHYGWSELVAVRDGRFKFIRAPRQELYDVARDPAESDDLARRDPGRADAMQRALEAMLARVSNPDAAKGPRPIDPETEERLEALGYIAAGGSARHLETRPRGDPKDKVRLYNLLKLAGSASAEGRIDEAIARAKEALAADPEIIEGHTLLGNFQAKAGRHQDAAASYKRALALDPEHQGALMSLAQAYRSLGRLADAEAGWQRARELDPRNGRVLLQLADLWIQQGRLQEAEGIIKQGLALEVDRPRFCLKLGECYIEMKRYADAEAQLREALALRPHAKTAHYNLALVHEARGETQKAIAEYEAELRNHPEGYRASFNLAKLLLQSGRTQDAVQRFREAVAANAEFGVGHLYLAKALLDAGDLQGAEEAARAGLAKRPGRTLAPLGHYVLADVYNRLGRAKDAAREVAAARRLERGG